MAHILHLGTCQNLTEHLPRLELGAWGSSLSLDSLGVFSSTWESANASGCKWLQLNFAALLWYAIVI